MAKKGIPHRNWSKEEKLKIIRIHLDEHVPQNALYMLILLTFPHFYMTKSEALTSDFVCSLGTRLKRPRAFLYAGATTLTIPENDPGEGKMICNSDNPFSAVP